MMRQTRARGLVSLGALCLPAVVGAATQSGQIDQLSIPTRSVKVAPAALPTGTSSSADVSQLSAVRGVAAPRSDELLEHSSVSDGVTVAQPAATVPTEIIAAIKLIEGRGQTPTLDLVAREVDPEVLSRYLTSVRARGIEQK